MAYSLFTKPEPAKIKIYGTDLNLKEWEGLKRAVIKAVYDATKEGLEAQTIDKTEFIERECKRAVGNIYVEPNTIEMTQDTFEFAKVGFQCLSDDLEEIIKTYEKKEKNEK